MLMNFQKYLRFKIFLTPHNNIEITILCIILISFCVFSIFVTPGHAQKKQEYGLIWKNMSKDERRFYLGGLQEGTYELFFIRELLTNRLEPSNSKEEIILKKLALSEPQRELLFEIINRHLNEIDTELFGVDVIADVMTNIYRDPANTFVDFHNTARVAVMKLKGKSDEDVTKELQRLRQATAEIMSKP